MDDYILMLQAQSQNQSNLRFRVGGMEVKSSWAAEVPSCNAHQPRSTEVLRSATVPASPCTHLPWPPLWVRVRQLATAAFHCSPPCPSHEGHFPTYCSGFWLGLADILVDDVTDAELLLLLRPYQLHTLMDENVLLLQEKPGHVSEKDVVVQICAKIVCWYYDSVKYYDLMSKEQIFIK